MSKTHSRYRPWIIWSLPLLFFTYQFILRLWPGQLMYPIMEQFSVDASQFGLLAALYYYGYAGMQIPVAILLDRFGVRRVVSLFALLCALATLTFTYTNQWWVACVSRFLVGVGSAAGILGVSKIISEWFPTTHYAKMIGLSFTIGLCGAIYGEKPVSLLIEAHSWQNVAFTLALVSIGIGLLVYSIVRLKPKQDVYFYEEEFSWSHFKAILSSPVLWWLGLVNLLLVGSLEGFSDVWGIQYLMTAYSISKVEAAQLMSFIFFGLLVGGLVLPLFNKKVGHYSLIALCGVGTVIAFIILFSLTTYSEVGLASLFFILGIFCCYQAIVFAAGSELVKEQHLGVTIAFLNCINMFGGSFFHTLIGTFMDTSWTGTLGVDGLKHYSLGSFHSALQIIPICAGIGALIIACLGVWVRRKQPNVALKTV